jgi:hypothetical protein
MRIDRVDGETYFGERLSELVLDAAGIVRRTTALPVLVVPAPGTDDDDDPPPPHAASSDAQMTTAVRRAIMVYVLGSRSELGSRR